MSDLDIHPSVYALARLLAKQGYGFEDICAKCKEISREHARAIVLGREVKTKEKANG